MDQVFISHSSEDKAEYDNLTFAFNNAGVNTWDVSGLHAGSPLSDQLKATIRNCNCCVFLATRRSVESKWCLAELGAFWGAGKKVVVYLCDPNLTEAELPPQFHGNVWTRSLEKAALAVRQTTPEHDKTQQRPSPVPGNRLFYYAGYYPIDLEEGTSRPLANPETYAKAIDYFLGERTYDRLAAMDLIYLRVDNPAHEPDFVPDSHLGRYAKLIEKYELESFIENFRAEKLNVFKDYLRLVNDVGETLREVFLELVLHDVRNPIRSVIAARNTKGISDQKVNDPSTRLVVNYVRNQGRDLIAAMEGGSKICYWKELTPTKPVKATTTPIYDDVYGLVGILCVNIDLAAIEALDNEGRKQFFENYKWNTGKTPAFELLQ